MRFAAGAASVGAMLVLLGVKLDASEHAHAFLRPTLLPLPLRPYRPPTGFELEHVSVIIRHGLRTPINNVFDAGTVWDCGTNNALRVSLHDAPSEAASVHKIDFNNLYRMRSIIGGPSPIKGNCTPGQLTRQGFAQHVLLGSFLRSRYVDEAGFLPKVFDTTTPEAARLYVRSSQYERTIESAQALLTGLYPPVTARAPGVRGQFAIFVKSPSKEDLYVRPEACPRARQLMEQYVASPERDALHTHLMEVMGRVGNKSEARDDLLWADLITSMDTVVLHGHQLPAGFTPELIRDIHVNTAREAKLAFGSAAIARVAVGTFLHDMMQAVDSRSFCLYSAHDNTLSPILGALGCFEEHPPLASNLIMEVYRDPQSSKRFVHLLFNGAPLRLALPTDSTVNEHYYEYGAFLELLRPTLVRPEDWKTACLEQ